MSVENKDIIDFASIDKSGMAVMTISDHLEWDSDNNHLHLLQEKVNSYLAAVESGDFYTKYPLATGRKIAIRVVMKYWPSPEGERFLLNVQRYLAANGYNFSYDMLVVR